MEWEREIGIERYLYREECRGYTRREPEDFVVEEEGPLGKASIRILNNQKAPMKPEGEGEYLYVVMEKRDWDTNDIIRKIARELHISRSRISFAGTKDKFALTAQWISLWKVKWGDIRSLNIKDVAFHTPIYMRRKLRRGQLKGNWFRVRIYGCNLEWVPEKFLNYFGHQRFGSYRFVSHRVGKYILLEDFEEAVRVYLTATSPWEPPETQEARRRLEKEWNIKEALRYFPHNLRKERSILSELSKGKDFKSALLSLPPNLISLFIHAYQSYIFNKALSISNEDTLIVPGYKVFPSGVEKELLDEDGITKEHFKRWKRFSTYGEERNTIEYPKHLRVEGNTVSFFLPAGTYATSYLRELLKPQSPIGFIISPEKVQQR